MTHVQSLYDQYRDLPEDAQKKAGKAISGDMNAEHREFLRLLLELTKKGSIDVTKPSTFLHPVVYDALDQKTRDSIDLALINLGHLLENILAFRLSTKTPDSSPQLQTMIEELWQMKNRLEEKVGDVLKF